MRDQTPYTSLKEAIKNLEQEQKDRAQLLKDQFKATYEGLKPFNMLKSTLKSCTESSEIRENFFGTLIPFVAGFLSKKGSPKTRRSAVINQAAILLLDILNRYISKNPEVIARLSHLFVSTLRKKKSPGRPAE